MAHPVYDVLGVCCVYKGELDSLRTGNSSILSEISRLKQREIELETRLDDTQEAIKTNEHLKREIGRVKEQFESAKRQHEIQLHELVMDNDLLI